MVKAFSDAEAWSLKSVLWIDQIQWTQRHVLPKDDLVAVDASRSLIVSFKTTSSTFLASF